MQHAPPWHGMHLTVHAGNMLLLRQHCAGAPRANAYLTKASLCVSLDSHSCADTTQLVLPHSQHQSAAKTDYSSNSNSHSSLRVHAEAIKRCLCCCRQARPAKLSSPRSLSHSHTQKHHSQAASLQESAHSINQSSCCTDGKLQHALLDCCKNRLPVCVHP